MSFGEQRDSVPRETLAYVAALSWLSTSATVLARAFYRKPLCMMTTTVTAPMRGVGVTRVAVVGKLRRDFGQARLAVFETARLAVFETVRLAVFETARLAVFETAPFAAAVRQAGADVGRLSASRLSLHCRECGASLHICRTLGA